MVTAECWRSGCIFERACLMGLCGNRRIALSSWLVDLLVVSPAIDGEPEDMR